MQRPIVWPAILSLTGVYSPFLVAAVFLSFTRVGGIAADLGLAVGGIAFLAGLWLTGLAVALLLDTVSHRIWGLLIAISYGVAFVPLYLVTAGLTGSGWPPVYQFLAWPAIFVPVLGVVGGVWGFFWKTSITAIPAGTELRRFLSLKDKPVVPFLISMVGAALPLYLLALLLEFLLEPAPFAQSGSNGSGLFLLFAPIAIGLFTFFAVMSLTFPVLLLYDERHRKNWGIVLSVWWGLASLITGAVVVSILLTGIDTLGIWFTAALFAPFLGFAGGISGIVWHTGRTRSI